MWAVPDFVVADPIDVLSSDGEYESEAELVASSDACSDEASTIGDSDAPMAALDSYNSN